MRLVLWAVPVILALLAAALLWPLGGHGANYTKGHCEQRHFEGASFLACRYDARAHRLELVLDAVLAVDAAGRVAIITSEEPVSFGRFARFIRDGLGCRDALYLDGAVSSLWDPGADRRDGSHAIGPRLTVYRRP